MSMEEKKDKKQAKIEKYKKKKRNKHYKGWYRFVRSVLFPIGKTMFPTTVLGMQNLPVDEKYILAGNHRSWKDLPTLGFSVPGFKHYVSKEEWLGNAVWRWLFSKIAVLTVNREKSDLSFMRNVVSALNKNEPIAIFPEGTRNMSAEELLGIKNGTALFAYKTGAWIVPFHIYKHPKVFKHNYLYIAPAFKVTDEAVTGVIDRDKLAEVAQLIKEKMMEAKAYTDDVVTNNKIREVKKADKAALKAWKVRRKEYIKQQKMLKKAKRRENAK